MNDKVEATKRKASLSDVFTILGLLDIIDMNLQRMEKVFDSSKMRKFVGGLGGRRKVRRDWRRVEKVVDMYITAAKEHAVELFVRESP